MNGTIDVAPLQADKMSITVGHETVELLRTDFLVWFRLEPVIADNSLALEKHYQDQKRTQSALSPWERAREEGLDEIPNEYIRLHFVAKALKARAENS